GFRRWGVGTGGNHQDQRDQDGGQHGNPAGERAPPPGPASAARPGESISLEETTHGRHPVFEPSSPRFAFGLNPWELERKAFPSRESLLSGGGPSTLVEACHHGPGGRGTRWRGEGDRKSTRLNSSHVKKSYAVFCLKKKN